MNCYFTYQKYQNSLKTCVTTTKETALAPFSLAHPVLMMCQNSFNLQQSGYLLQATLADGYLLQATIAGGYLSQATLADGYLLQATLAVCYLLQATLADGCLL